MTQDTKHLVAHTTLRLGLLCVWFVFVTLVTTTACFFICQSLLQNSSTHDEAFRTAVIYGVSVVWIVAQVFLGLLFPAWFLKKLSKNRR